MNLMIRFLKLFFLKISGMGNRGSMLFSKLNIPRECQLGENLIVLLQGKNVQVCLLPKGQRAMEPLCCLILLLADEICCQIFWHSSYFFTNSVQSFLIVGQQQPTPILGSAQTEITNAFRKSFYASRTWPDPELGISTNKIWSLFCIGILSL